MHNIQIALVVLLTVATAVPTLAAAEAGAMPWAEEVLRRSFSTATREEWSMRLKQDEVQTLCSKYRNSPPPNVAARILASQRGTLRYPADGKLIGDWRAGERLASIGTGGNIGRIKPDRPATPKGGNCYACHALAPDEVSAGTLGPSLTGFGKQHGNSPDAVKYTYETVYNAQAFHACSLMPRFGYHQWLTPQEIADAVAFLLDPESPVNR